MFSGGVAAPVGYFFQAFSAGVFEESYFVAGVFEFVDVGPDFGLTRALVDFGGSATGAAGVESDTGLEKKLHFA